MHEAFGFEKVAHFKQVGRKFEEWVGLGYWALLLDKERVTKPLARPDSNNTVLGQADRLQSARSGRFVAPSAITVLKLTNLESDYR